MKTIVDVITESMNDYGNDFKECETLEQFICKFLAINDLDDFNKYLYSELEDNGDLFTVCKLLGHKDIQTTQIYAEVIMPTRIEAVNRLSDFFGQG